MKREDTALKASACFLGGAQKLFDGVSEDLLGGTGKAEDVEAAGRRNHPEAMPNGKGGNGNMDQSNSNRRYRERKPQKKKERLTFGARLSRASEKCLDYDQ